MNPYDLPLSTIEQLVGQHGTPIYIVSRRKLIENYKAAFPKGAVLVCSGYLQDATVRQAVEAGGAAFLGKPFLPRELGDVASDLLGAQQRACSEDAR